MYSAWSRRVGKEEESEVPEAIFKGNTVEKIWDITAILWMGMLGEALRDSFSKKLDLPHKGAGFTWGKKGMICGDERPGAAMPLACFHLATKAGKVRNVSKGQPVKRHLHFLPQVVRAINVGKVKCSRVKTIF